MMKHTIHAMLLLLSTVAGCGKAPVRNDVEGFWKLREITLLSTNETTGRENMYYCITPLVTEVRGAEAGDFVARTGYAGNETKLVLKDFKTRYGTADNGEDAPPDGLRAYGINSQEETVFSILECDGKMMVLQSDYSRLELEKF